MFISFISDVINSKIVNIILPSNKKSVGWFSIIILLFSWSSFDAFSAEYDYKILIVSSYHQSFEAERGMIESLNSSLLAKSKIQTMYLDSKQLPIKQVQKKAERLLTEIKNIVPDLIYLCDDNAIKFLAESLLLQQKKVVILGVNENPRNYVNSELMPFLQGVLERPLYIRAVLALKQFYPNATKVTILMDNTVTSNIIKKQIFSGEKTQRGQITIDYKQVASFKELKTFIQQVNDQPDHQLFLTTLFNLTDHKSAEYKSYSSKLTWLNEHYRKPLFSFWKTKVREHLVLAAYGPSEEEQGRAAAEMGNHILQGREIKHRFITPQNGRYYISQKQLDKFDLEIPATYLLSGDAVFH